MKLRMPRFRRRDLPPLFPEIDNARDRYGTAGFCDAATAERAGALNHDDGGVYAGTMGGRPVVYSGPGGVLICAGARTGKMTMIGGQNLCTPFLSGNMIVLDGKFEAADIGRLQVAHNKHCYYWDPIGGSGFPDARMNPLDYLRADSASLGSDIKVFSQNAIPLSGSANAIYFERRAQEYLEAIGLTLAHIDEVLTYPRLYHIINLIPLDNEEWRAFAYEMHRMGGVPARIEEEIANSREREGGGFLGILGELFKAFAPLSDPALMRALSPRDDGSYDFSLSEMLCTDKRFQVHLFAPLEFTEAWAPILKAFFVAGMIYKSRAPSAPRQNWWIEEASFLKGFPALTQMFVAGAGIGTRPIISIQSLFQLKAIGGDAESIIPSSAGLQVFFGVRDDPSAELLSRRLGVQTLEYDDERAQAEAAHRRQEALYALASGEDAVSAALKASHFGHTSTLPQKKDRLLRTPDEITNMPPDRMIVFMDGLPRPLWAERAPFWTQSWMAGRYLPSRFNPPSHQVQVMGPRGPETRRVITEPVPDRFAHFPQYRDGYWSYVEGYRP